MRREAGASLMFAARGLGRKKTSAIPVAAAERSEAAL